MTEKAQEIYLKVLELLSKAYEKLSVYDRLPGFILLVILVLLISIVFGLNDPIANAIQILSATHVFVIILVTIFLLFIFLLFLVLPRLRIKTKETPDQEHLEEEGVKTFPVRVMIYTGGKGANGVQGATVKLFLNPPQVLTTDRDGVVCFQVPQNEQALEKRLSISDDRLKPVEDQMILLEPGKLLEIPAELINPEPPQGEEETTQKNRDYADTELYKARQAYLQDFTRQCYHLPLNPMGGENSQFGNITLKDVYININTKRRISQENNNKVSDGELFNVNNVDLYLEKQENERFDKKEKTLPLSSFHAARLCKEMVITGGPGSGKSSFARYLLANYASAFLGYETLPNGMDKKLFPLIINLREIYHLITEVNIDDRNPKRAYPALVEQLKEFLLGTTFIKAPEILKYIFIQDWDNQKLFLVFDGFDEVPEHHRKAVRCLMLAVREMVNPERLIITCRVRSYNGDAVIPGLPVFELDDLSEKQITAFIAGWYQYQADNQYIPVEMAKERIPNLQRAALRPTLISLSQNPMLLTTMTIIHQRKAELPDQRVRLYKQAVQLLLVDWQLAHTESIPSTPEVEAFLRDEQKLFEAVEELAFETHRAEKGNIPRMTAVGILEKYIGSMDQAGHFLDYVDQRSGLIVGFGGDLGKHGFYGFPHRTFQEYMAGCYLANKRGFHNQLFKLAAEGDYWSLAVKMAVEELYHNRRNMEKLLDTAYQLCPKNTCGGEQHQRAVLWAGYITQQVGVDEILQDNDAAYCGKTFLEELRQALVDLFGQDLTPKEWAEAGEILAEIGDPRFYGEELFFLPRDENLGFVKVPAGKFWMGSDPKIDELSRDNERPLHEVELPTYYLSKFMVTVAQFRHFSEAAAYTKFDIRALRDKNNQPVRFVTWYDAIQYCTWLQKALIKSAHTPAWMREKLNLGWRVTLPSEAEWEKAARGITKNQYPWGDTVIPEDANYNLTQINGPSAVGCFEGHGLFEQFYDLSGNLWEWTRSLWGKEFNKPNFDYPYVNILKREVLDAPKDVLRVRRGGSYFDDVDGLRCAIRGRYRPSFMGSIYGFRIVLSPPRLGSGPSER